MKRDQDYQNNAYASTQYYEAAGGERVLFKEVLDSFQNGLSKKKPCAEMIDDEGIVLSKKKQHDFFVVSKKNSQVKVK